MRWLLLFALVGCYQDPHFGDCEVACTTTCPGDLQCVAGACRVAGAMGQCMVMSGGDAGGSDGGIDDAPIDANPNDPDHDGILTPQDNCPMNANPDQNDEDGDGKGDPCDPCPIANGSGTTADADDDGDGVGNACDPSAATQDKIALMAGFKTAPDGANIVGTVSFTGGSAIVAAPSGTSSGVFWAGTSAASIKFFTQVTVTTEHGQSAAASIFGHYDGTSNTGVACSLLTSGTANRNAAVTNLVDNSNTIDFTGASWSPNSSYALTATVGTNNRWNCTYPGADAAVTIQASGTGWGVVTVSDTATFEYLLVVITP